MALRLNSISVTVGVLAGVAPRRLADVARYVLALAVAGSLLGGCSIKRAAVNVVGDAITGGGGVFNSDEDPDLVREAIPFGLKTYESLLAVSPEHEGLLFASAQGFTAYAFMLQREADEADAGDLPAAKKLRARAHRLYLRGRDYGLRGLEAAHPGFTAKLRRDRAAALAETTKDDVRFLYWSGAAWAGALSAAKDDLELIAELPIAGALVGRVLALDEAYERGTAHEFFISFEGSRPGGSAGKARKHYRRALELSDGARASVHVALAEAVVVREQGLAEFRSLIAKALDVDPDRAPNQRVVNILAQRRARWLESRIPDLFLDADIARK